MLRHFGFKTNSNNSVRKAKWTISILWCKWDSGLCSRLCVHLNSQIYSDHVSRREIVIEQIINDILKLENGLNTTNTIIVGDFNINPYDNSCVNARYFHGIPIYEDAMRESRNIAGKEFRMFYNPRFNSQNSHIKKSLACNAGVNSNPSSKE